MLKTIYLLFYSHYGSNGVVYSRAYDDVSTSLTNLFVIGQ